MMRAYNCFKILLLSFMIFLLSGCSADDDSLSESILGPVPTIAEGTPYVFIFEDYDGLVQEAGEYARFSTAKVENVNYYIDRDDYSLDECTEIVHHIKEMLDLLLEEYYFSPFEQMNVYIGSKIISQGTKGNIYLNKNDLETQSELITMMAGLCGELVNYGLCYGLSSHIENRLGRNVSVPDMPEYYITDKQLGVYFSKEDNIVLLDFSIPVFENIYFKSEDNQYAVFAARSFIKYVTEYYGMNELALLIMLSSEMTLDFDEHYTDMCNKWLSDIGALSCRQTPETVIRCIRNTERTNTMYDYVFYTHSMSSYITKDYFDSSINIVLTYPAIIHLLTLGEADLKITKEYLSPYFNTDLEQIPCYYYFQSMNYYVGYKIYFMSPYWAFVHEYTHYITDEITNTKLRWLEEGIAEYMAFYIPSSLLEFHIERVRPELKLHNDGAASKGSSFNDVLAYYNYNKESRDSINERLVGKGELEGGFLTYSEAGSMVNYLITEYGADTFFSMYKQEITFEEAYGGNFSELYEEWGNYITNKYKNIL